MEQQQRGNPAVIGGMLWRPSSFTATTCVDVAASGGTAFVARTQDRDQSDRPVLAVPGGQWSAFLARVRES